MCSVDDFKPSDSKRLKRIQAVRETAEIALELYNAISTRDRKLGEPILLKESGIEALVEKYFRNVAAFKIRNDYKLTDRINQEKICALLLRTCAHGRWDDIFGIKQKYPPHDFMEKLYNEFSFILICAFAGVPDTAGMGSIQRDFQICMHQKQFMPDEWACLMMTAFVKAYGQRLDNTD
ncbi:hypothetical protein F1643_00740 [Azospirillum sp. INR13]|uniref:hypothetical protein n=1 Tax=Azospirillum sp. INR13 TaxID=2596919 RepID=UPI0018920EBA|nr:hypothetical protein [Azospirillum sp. INR13]MBF5093208.1 hypothetical protein [Azospirillum sp. INR13]